MNKLFLVTGPSGCGKTTIMKSLMRNEVISFTTRNKRSGETEGETYKFISFDDFKSLMNNNKLIECVQYSGNYYGIDSDELNAKLNVGDAFCIVDFYGMKQLKEIHKRCTTIFLYTPYEQAYEQMLARGDSPDVVNKRLITYQDEMLNRHNYDYVIKNNPGQLDKTKEIVRYILLSEVINT